MKVNFSTVLVAPVASSMHHIRYDFTNLCQKFPRPHVTPILTMDMSGALETASCNAKNAQLHQAWCSGDTKAPFKTNEEVMSG